MRINITLVLLRELFIQLQLPWVLFNNERGLADEWNFLVFDAVERDSLQTTFVVFESICKASVLFKV